MTKKQIKSRIYRATPDELQALDEAEQSGIATDEEVEAAFRSSQSVYQLDDEERADILAGLAEMDRGEVASDEEVKAVFDGLRKRRK